MSCWAIYPPYKRKIMETLIQLLFTQFISEETSPLLPLLYNLKPLVLTSALHLQPADLQLLQYLIAKNFLTYSPAHLQIRLQPHAVLFYQRVHKLKTFAATHLDPHFTQLLAEFIANDLLPVSFSAKSLHALHHPHPQAHHHKPADGKGKKKKEDEPTVASSHAGTKAIDYTRLVCEYSEEKDKQEVECVVNLGDLTQMLRLWKIEELLGSRAKEYLKGLTYKEGEEHLDSLSFREMYRITKENRPKAQFIEQLISKIKQEQIQQYILQIFRRYDSEVEKDDTPLSRNLLLVFNLIKKSPLQTEKELMERSLLPVLVLRKCLNLLVADGLVNYYPENIRSTLYRITCYPEIEDRFLDHVSQAIVNLHKASANRELAKEQLLKMECMINSLDDTLLIFGY